MSLEIDLLGHYMYIVPAHDFICWHEHNLFNHHCKDVQWFLTVLIFFAKKLPTWLLYLCVKKARQLTYPK